MDPSQREVRIMLYFSYFHHSFRTGSGTLPSARAAKNMFEPYTLFKLWDYNFAYVTTHTRTSRSWGARAGPHAALLPAPAAHSPHAPTPDPHHGPSDTRVTARMRHHASRLLCPHAFPRGHRTGTSQPTSVAWPVGELLR